MKNSVFAAALLGACLTSCDRHKTAVSETPPPVVVPATAPEIVEPRPPAAVRVIEPQDFKIGEEEPGNFEPTPTPGQRLDHAIDKTEDGLRRAAEATGGALRRAGDAIERKADEKSR